MFVKTVVTFLGYHFYNFGCFKIPVERVELPFAGYKNTNDLLDFDWGYYEVNGYKFTKYYYEKLWNGGRGGITFVADEIIRNGQYVKIADPRGFPGFYKYTTKGWTQNWEMIYNPTTKEITHIMPLPIKK